MKERASSHPARTPGTRPPNASSRFSTAASRLSIPAPSPAARSEPSSTYRSVILAEAVVYSSAPAIAAPITPIRMTRVLYRLNASVSERCSALLSWLAATWGIGQAGNGSGPARAVAQPHRHRRGGSFGLRLAQPVGELRKAGVGDRAHRLVDKPRHGHLPAAGGLQGQGHLVAHVQSHAVAQGHRQQHAPLGQARGEAVHGSVTLEGVQQRAVAEKAVETGDVEPVYDVLAAELRDQLERRLHRVGELATAKDRSVGDARAWVEAMLGFQVYAYHTYTALRTRSHGEHHPG
jgi:hypothetical protein